MIFYIHTCNVYKYTYNTVYYIIIVFISRFVTHNTMKLLPRGLFTQAWSLNYPIFEVFLGQNLGAHYIKFLLFLSSYPDIYGLFTY